MHARMPPFSKSTSKICLFFCIFQPTASALATLMTSLGSPLVRHLVGVPPTISKKIGHLKGYRERTDALHFQRRNLALAVGGSVFQCGRRWTSILARHDDADPEYSSQTQQSPKEQTLDESLTPQTSQPEINMGRYWTLPRLYVGPRHNAPTQISPISSIVSLTSGSQVVLSEDQSHYLTSVMRIFKKRIRASYNQQSNQYQDDDNDGNHSLPERDFRDFIRIFDGQNGEWLARVVPSGHFVVEEPPHGKGSRKSKRRKENNLLMAECLQQIKPQSQPQSQQSCNLIDFSDDLPWIFFVPLRKQPRMKLMVEKCTELGVGRFVPIISDHMEGAALTTLLGSNYDDSYSSHPDPFFNGATDVIGEFEKLELQAIEASEQCERLGVPIITKSTPLHMRSGNGSESKKGLWGVKNLVEQWRDQWTHSGSAGNNGIKGRTLLICRERGKEGNVIPLLHSLQQNTKVAFVVGPEGGWSSEEEEIFDAVCSPYNNGSDDAAEVQIQPVQCVSFGSSVLRAETACMMAVGAWALAYDSLNSVTSMKDNA